MKFSIIIPLYNKAPYIRKALESVLAQTYTDYELIVVDDGSTDESASIVEELLASPKSSLKGKDLNTEENFPSLQGEKSPEWTFDSERPFITPMEGNVQTGEQKNRGRLIRQANAGVSAARNNGVAQASGEYIAFLDADDWWESTYLERMAQLIKDYPEAGLYACNYYYHKDGTNIIKVDIPTGYFNYPKEYFNNFAMPVFTGATMMHRRVYDDMEGFPLGIKLGEDFLLWAKVAMNYKVAFLNEPLAYYNNTLPPNHRATYKLHNPNDHMLFRLDILGNKAMQLLSEENNDWRHLIDMLRLHGLYNYWLSDEYHEIAQKELDKVCWKDQHDFLIKMYDKPRWYLQRKQRLVRIVSRLKHKFK